MSDSQPQPRPLSGRFLEQTERRIDSIYSRFRAPRTSQEMDELFRDSELPLSLKFSAVLAAFAYFTFPLQLSTFRSLIPCSAWNEHFRFRLTRLVAGFVPIDWGQNEWFYELRIGPQSRYGLHIVYFVAGSAVIAGQNEDGFVPPLDSSVMRYTLCHPFLQSELHDPSGIYLFKSC